MLTRSHRPVTQPASPQLNNQATQVASHDSRISIDTSLIKDDDDDQREVIRKLCRSRLKLEAQDLQVNPTLSLSRGRDTFLIASTGYGKSLVPVLYYLMFPKSAKPIVLTLNPLDALGNNQVQEKKILGLSAINLTSATFNQEAIDGILSGKYVFIYVSPEIFLNNNKFKTLYFSNSFQKRLILKVVDEAHLIYSWGLVMSGKMKSLQSHHIHQDRTPFRPSYGSLIDRFLATEAVPSILMSATCPPQYVEQILASLKITKEYIDMHIGELTRPEIRFIRVGLPSMQKPWNTLKKLFSSKLIVSDSELVPTLVYCHSQNDTYVALETINVARRNKEESLNGLSNSVRRFHADTCPLDKERHAEDFMNGKFNIFTCTNALGLGQNWKRVRRVIISGQLDCMDIIQMAGRAGRDKQPAVAILLVRPLSTVEESSIFDLSHPEDQDDDQRMHAMSITEVCLRVAFSVLLRCGYIPLSKTSSTVMTETQRQKDAGMPTCLCSNCNPKAADFFLAQQPRLSKSNFTDLVVQEVIPETYPSLDDQYDDPDAEDPSPYSKIRSVGPEDPTHTDLRFIRLLLKIEQALITLFLSEYPAGGFYTLEDLFPREKLWRICVNYDLCLETIYLDLIFGSEPLPKAYAAIFQTITSWKANRKDIFAVLDPSEAELRIHYEAKARIEKFRKDSQEAKQAAADRKRQARSVMEGLAVSTSAQREQTIVSGASNKKRPPPKVARGVRKTKEKKGIHTSSTPA